MTEPSTPSQPSEEQNRNDQTLEQMKTELREKRVDPSRLTHVVVPGDNLVGELVGWEAEFMKIKNPKRLVKQQNMVPGKGLMVSISMVDWDLVEEGVIHVHPITYVPIRDMNAETQRRYYGIYLGYLDDKVIQRARAAGIEIAGADQLPKGDVRRIG